MAGKGFFAAVPQRVETLLKRVGSCGLMAEDSYSLQSPPTRSIRILPLEALILTAPKVAACEGGSILGAFSTDDFYGLLLPHHFPSAVPASSLTSAAAIAAGIYPPVHCFVPASLAQSTDCQSRLSSWGPAIGGAPISRGNFLSSTLLSVIRGEDGNTAAWRHQGKASRRENTARGRTGQNIFSRHEALPRAKSGGYQL